MPGLLLKGKKRVDTENPDQEGTSTSEGHTGRWKKQPSASKGEET